MFDLAGKKALVTGSSQGIGKEIAKVLAANGAQVFVHGSKSKEKVQRIVDEITGKGFTAYNVVSDLAAADCSESLYAQTGDIDILVLNASVQIRKPWAEITEQEFDLQVDVNLKAALKLMQKYAPAMMLRRWGRIITVGSIQQYKPHKDMLVYAATKEAQMSFVRNLAKQLSAYGITVNNMAPGTIETPRTSGVLQNEEYRKACQEQIPCGYFGKPEDCAAGVLLLCSEEGRYINGIDLICDGGLHL